MIEPTVPPGSAPDRTTGAKGQKATITAEEVAARAAIMKIKLYPDLPVLLKKTLGYGPHVDVLQHLVYWFHPRHPSMQHRWTLFKTFLEWHEECGLSDRQVKKGRNRLRELGVLTWRRGQYGRVHYRVDWLALANLLGVFNPDGYGVPIDDLDDDPFDGDPFDDLGDFNPDDYGVPIQSGHQGVPFNLDGYGVPFNPDGKASDPIQEVTKEATARDYSQEGSPLQGAGCRKTDIPRGATNKDFKDLEEHPCSEPSDDKRHPQNNATPPEKTAPKEKVDEPPLVEETDPPAPPEPEDAQLLAEVREVLDPDSGMWIRFFAESVRAKYNGPGYTAEKVAGYLADDEDLPYAGRKADLVPCVLFIFYEWSNERKAAVA